MGSDGNCKYLPMLSLSYVKVCFPLVSDCIKLRHCGKPGACIILQLNARANHCVMFGCT